MPTNPFPDSAEKRELRRRDYYLLQERHRDAGRELSYCGLPSIEFLDVKEWRSVLSKVKALELDPEIVSDMEIERDRALPDLPVDIENTDALEFLTSTIDVYDIYNLDFYGGFLNRPNGPSRSTDSLRFLFTRHSQQRRSFTLIATFNVKEMGMDAYAKFMAEARQHLAYKVGAEGSIRAHEYSAAAKIKLCFLYFCWQQSQAANFTFEPSRVYVYTSSATMVHFHIWFRFAATGAMRASADASLVTALNATLYRMKGQIPRPELVPPQIS